MSSHGGGSSGQSAESEARLEELIDRAKSGSTSALGRALNACRPRLLRAARRAVAHRLRPVVGASDIVQDTFVNATRAFRVFRGRRASEFVNWLHRILANKLAEVARRGKPQNDLAQVPLDDSLEPWRYQSPESPGSPSSIVGSQEFTAMIVAGLARLPDRYQQVLHLRFSEGLSFPQIGERLSLTEDGARMLFSRAVKRLRKKMPPKPAK
jgi:RNA polymerase sigma-70 factor (subfamily 1)